MANDETVFREVDQELAEERQIAFIRQQAPYILGAAAFVVAIVAGVQIIDGRRAAAAGRDAAAFNDAANLYAEDPALGIDALARLGAEGDSGYRLLAEMRRAAILAGNGHRDDARIVYRNVYRDGAASKRLKDLARLRAAYIALDVDRSAVLEEIGDLESDPTALGAHAREVAGLAALQDGDYQGAEDRFELLALDPAASQTLRERAREFAALAAAGRVGVAIVEEIDVQDLVGALGRADEATPDGEYLLKSLVGDVIGPEEVERAVDEATAAPDGGAVEDAPGSAGAAPGQAPEEDAQTGVSPTDEEADAGDAADEGSTVQ